MNPSNFLADTLARAQYRTSAYIYDREKRRLPNRNAYVRINKYLRDFLHNTGQIRWITLTGLRGTGKTTLLAQIYENADLPVSHKLLVSMDQAKQLAGVSLMQLLESYEEVLGMPFERLAERVILLIDEAQYDEDWALTLKTLYDRTDKIFIIASGSSALALQTSPDSARRTIFERLLPMSFTEYQKIINRKFEKAGLCKDIRQVVLQSANAEETYAALLALRVQVLQYWSNIDRLELYKYMRFGTLPFMALLDNEALAYDQLEKMLDRIISGDVARIGQFDPDTVSAIPQILYLLAESETMSQNDIANKVGIKRPTLQQILYALEKTETLQRIYPYGSHAKQVRKASKYLFSTPAFRSMYFAMVGSTRAEEEVRGRLLEDLVGMYLHRLIPARGADFITYDPSKGAADFVVKSQGKTLVIEAGMGDKKMTQVRKTMKKVSASMGIVVSTGELSVDKEANIVKIPLQFFVLM